MFDDLVAYFLQVLFYGKKNTKFSPDTRGYVSRALSWALECINPFSGKKKILRVILSAIPVVVKVIWNLVAGKGFDMWSVLKHLFLSILSAIVSSVLGRTTKKQDFAAEAKISW